MAHEITVWHIGGGSDEIGPIARVHEAGFRLDMVTFEAMDGYCVAGAEGEADFYVNRHPMSSGLYRCNPRYGAETYDKTQITWAENTEIERTVRVKTTTVDILRAKYPQPDVLSIDTQGAELSILQGAADTLRNTLCVVSEVEFVPIYEWQPLFDDQMRLLSAAGFRLMSLESPQHWHTGPKFGLGLFTVAEAVWLRFDYESLRPDQVERLAMIAAGFGRMSYCLRLCEHLKGELTVPWLQNLWTLKDNPELRAL